MGEIVYEISHVVLEIEKMTSRALFPRNPGDPSHCCHWKPSAVGNQGKGVWRFNRGSKLQFERKK